MNIMEEVWKDVIGYEGSYQVSNLGRVKSLKYGNERILKKIINGDGYCILSLHMNGNKKMFTVHKLVAIIFLNYTSSIRTIVIDHIDGDKTNNNVNNLRIVKQRENVSTCFRKDKSKWSSQYIGVCYDKKNNKWISQIRIEGKIHKLGRFNSEIQASEAYQNKLKEIF